jgi:hypothetical protein
LKYRPETPPNTPQRARSAARQNERENRNLDSPEHRRTPHHSGPAQIPPLQLPIPPAPPVPGNATVPDDPFGPPPAPIQFDGRQYRHLPQHLAQQIQNLPAAGHSVPVSVKALEYLFSLSENFKPRYPNLPLHLAQQLAALPALPSPQRRRGRGIHVAPAVPVSCENHTDGWHIDA